MCVCVCVTGPHLVGWHRYTRLTGRLCTMLAIYPAPAQFATNGL